MAPPVEEVKRILSLDGGGLYGLTSALWLKQLCQRCPTFLAENDVQVFAGCSAGALNALLLARERVPRDFVLAGGLEDFWRQPQTFSNSNPVTAWLSLFQVTSWLGADDFLQLLRTRFGDLTLGDLHHRVLITTFDWTGAASPGSGAPPPGPHPLPGPAPWNPWACLWGQGWGHWPQNPFQVVPADPGVCQRSWRPRLLKNFPDHDPGGRLRVVDVAYDASAPPGLRPLRDGFGDGGTFNASPAADSVAAVVNWARHNWERRANAGRRSTEDVEVGEVAPYFQDEKVGENEPYFQVIADVCQRLHLLSVGVGSAKPSYWLKGFDFSSAQFSLIPTNPPNGNWFPPQWSVALDAPSENANFLARSMVGPHKFHRIDPGLLRLPTAVAAYWARLPAMRDLLTQEIYGAVETPASQQAVHKAVQFIEDGWFHIPPT